MQRELANKTTVERDWVVFSPSMQSLFCFACRLFGVNLAENEVFATKGFNDWANSHRSIKAHENSQKHKHNYLTYRRRAKQFNTIESSIESAEEAESK